MESKKKKVLKFLLWLFIGIPICLWAFFRDAYQYWGTIYIQLKEGIEEIEKSKLQN